MALLTGTESAVERVRHHAGPLRRNSYHGVRWQNGMDRRIAFSRWTLVRPSTPVTLGLIMNGDPGRITELRSEDDGS